MAPPRQANRLELVTIQQPSEAGDRDALPGLSQRKLNALGLPLAYVDRQQRYRFTNKAFLDWIARRSDSVVGREMIEVLGRDVYQLYEAYIGAALSSTGCGWSPTASARRSSTSTASSRSASPTARSPSGSASRPTTCSATPSATC